MKTLDGPRGTIAIGRDRDFIFVETVKDGKYSFVATNNIAVLDAFIIQTCNPGYSLSEISDMLSSLPLNPTRIGYFNRCLLIHGKTL